VKLVEVSNNNCADSVTKTVTVNPKPNIGFTINNTAQCVNVNNFILNDTSSISSGTITRKWNLGNGISDTSSLPNPNKSYTNANSYSVKLISISNNNCSDSVTKTVTVNPKPNVGFAINNASQCINGNNFLFNDTSSINSGTITRKWNFGNGNSDTSSLSNSTKSYSNANSYSVKLISISNNNCMDSVTKTVVVNPKPNVGFMINNSTQCVNGNNFIFNDTSSISSGTITRKWNFGNGISDTSSLTNSTKSYTNANSYSVKLVSISNNNCSDSVAKTVTVNPKPIVGFTQNFLSQCFSGNNFVLNDTSNISSGTISRAWDFGDAITSSNSSANKNYSTAGSYQIKLVETSNNNCKDSLTKSVIVYAQPKSGFTIDNNSQCLIGNSFSFDDTTSTTNTRLWNLGDGTNNVNDTFSKTYATAGSYNVNLRIADAHNCADSTIKTITVKPSPAKPIITSLSKSQLQSSVANSYQWYQNGNLLGGATSQQLTLTSNGNYSVKIDSTNGCNNTSDPFAALAVGIAEVLKSNGIQVYPNPNNGVFTINFNGLTGEKQISIYDLQGKLLNSYSTSENKFDISCAFAKGIYFLHCETSEGMVNKKIVVE